MKELAPDEKKLIDNISEYGWHVIQVEGDDTGPGFCYSVGLYETFQAPEIVVTGLPLDLAHEMINIMGDDIASGMQYESGKYYSDIIENYQCYMSKVDGSFYKDYFGYGIWYYKNETFPVLQCLYPSDDNVYPWDWTEDEQMYQPVLSENKQE
ncbi:MAG: DUF4262 domain-containing protein [Bacteroidota bacterium]